MPVFNALILTSDIGDQRLLQMNCALTKPDTLLRIGKESFYELKSGSFMENLIEDIRRLYNLGIL